MRDGSRNSPATLRRPWPDHAAVWRWHFYAGLFCLPFVCWLAITGSIYLFRPEIEAILDRPYEALHLARPRPTPSREAGAALAAVPGSAFKRYEPPATPTGAAQVIVTRAACPGASTSIRATSIPCAWRATTRGPWTCWPTCTASSS